MTKKHTLSQWVIAARLRTLPLSVSGILLASAVAYTHGFFEVQIFVLTVLTSFCLQILSNFANDYGDGVKGTDDHRIGPARAIQSGGITPTKMLLVIKFLSVIILIMILLLVYIAFGRDDFFNITIFALLGISAIVAAIKYTMGKNAYGYIGLGDVFTFIFFGLVSVLGTYFLYTKVFDSILILLGVAIGLLCVGVLNLNNMRDIDNDKKSNKRTLVVMMGSKNAKQYHTALIIVAMLCMLAYTYSTSVFYKDYAYYILYIPMMTHLYRVRIAKSPKQYDPELKKLAMLTFFIAIVFSLNLVF